MAYAGRDLTVIHPEVMSEKVTADDGVLYLDNKDNFERYRVLILPGMSMISLDNLRLIKKFWESGGKIIATVELPTKAFTTTKTRTAARRTFSPPTRPRRTAPTMSRAVSSRIYSANSTSRMTPRSSVCRRSTSAAR